MNGALLLIPFLLLRFGLLALLNKEAVVRAAHFPPMIGREKVAHWFYQLSSVAILLCMFFLRVERKTPGLFLTGLSAYGLGLLLCALSIVHFARPSGNGLNVNGLYRLSRNPMYVAYFIYFLGCAMITRSVVLLVLVLIFQITAHWMVRAEERWCAKEFGDAYLQYRQKVRRYF